MSAPRLQPRGGAAAASVLGDLVDLARPRQWLKSTVALAPLVFSGQLRDAVSQRDALAAFVAFCLASSALYALNDVCDREYDRAHPVKRTRPVAAGRVSAATALAEAVLLAGGAFAVGWLLAPRFLSVLAAFVLLHVAYSLVLKRVAILDIMAIAVGFVLRVQGGIDAIGAPQSAWILLCMFSMALFLGAGKRRAELALHRGAEAAGHRPALAAYSVPYLDVLLGLSATTALVCYSLYAVTVQPSETFLVTILPVAFGILRYMMIVVARAGGEDPDEALVRDGQVRAAVVVWTVLCVWILYGTLELFPVS